MTVTGPYSLLNDAAKTTLVGSISAGATTLSILRVTGSPASASPSFRIWIDDEIYLVTGKSTSGPNDIYTVIPGAEHTIAAAHTSGATVFYPTTSGVAVELAIAIERVADSGGTVTAIEVESVGYWSPLTNGDPDTPELVFSGGDVIMIWTTT